MQGYEVKMKGNIETKYIIKESWPRWISQGSQGEDRIEGREQRFWTESNLEKWYHIVAAKKREREKKWRWKK